MSRNKKRLSRRLRKLKKIGKKISRINAPDKIDHLITSDNAIPVSKVRDENSAEPIRPERTVEFNQYDKVKSQEIIGNLRTVITVSLTSLLILGILFYFEQQNGWVENLNTQIKNLMEGWTWKF